MAMANGPFQDVFPIESGDMPASYISLPALPEGTSCLLRFHWEELPRPRFCAVHPPSRGRTVKLRHLELQGFRMSAPKVGIRQGFPYGSWVVFGWSLLLGVSHPTTMRHPENERRVSEHPYHPWDWYIYLHLPITFTYIYHKSQPNVGKF